jgi:hypothetical protein
MPRQDCIIYFLSSILYRELKRLVNDAQEDNVAQCRPRLDIA